MIHGAKSGVQVRRFRWLSTLWHTKHWTVTVALRNAVIIVEIRSLIRFFLPQEKKKKFSLVGFSLYFRKPSTSALDGNDRSCNCIFTSVHRSIKHSYLQLSLAGESRIANHRFQVYRSKPSNVEFFRRWKRPIELT